MDSALAARLPLEMLHRIGEVNFFAIDPRFLQSAIHDFSGRSDERFSGHVFMIAGLLADQHDWRFFGSFAENGLGCAFVQVTGGAFLGGLAYSRQVR